MGDALRESHPVPTPGGSLAVAKRPCLSRGPDGHRHATGKQRSWNDPVPLLVPLACPQKASPGKEVWDTVVGGPAIFGMLGLASVGFGTLLFGWLVAGVWIIVAAGVGVSMVLISSRFFR